MCSSCFGRGQGDRAPLRAYHASPHFGTSEGQVELIGFISQLGYVTRKHYLLSLNRGVKTEPTWHRPAA